MRDRKEIKQDTGNYTKQNEQILEVLLDIRELLQNQTETIQDKNEVESKKATEGVVSTSFEITS